MKKPWPTYSKSDLAVKLVSDQTLFTGKSMADIKNRIAELKKLEIAAANELYVEAEKLPQLADATGRTITAKVYIPLSTFKALYGIKNIDRSVGSLSGERVELTEIRVEFGSVKEVIPALPLLRNCLNRTRKGKADYEIHTPLLQK